MTSDPHTVRHLADLVELYGCPSDRAVAKVADRLTPEYRRLVEASPFLALATCGGSGLECSPRGDEGPVVRVVDDRTLWLPDWRGNRRLDSLRNLIEDPRCAALFLIPGSGTTLRLSADARITTDPDILDAFAVAGKRRPTTVVVLAITRVFFQCARAVVRAGLWNPDRMSDPAQLPTAGEMLEERTGGGVDGEAYDSEWRGRMRDSIW